MESDKAAFFKHLDGLAASYLPEWKYAPEAGEPASALLQICGELLWDSRERAQRLFPKHATEFLNCLDPVCKAAEPSCCWLALRVPAKAADVFFPKGTRVYTAAGGGIKTFSLRHALSVSSTALRELYFSSAARQKLIRALSSEEDQTRLHLPLFDFRREGGQKNEARFYHSALFHSGGGALLYFCPAAADRDRMLQELADPARLQWSLEGSEGEQLLAPPERRNGELRFTLPASAADCLLARTIPGALPPEQCVYGVELKTGRGPVPAERVLCGGEQENPERFLPFGRELTVYAECMLASEEILRHRGSRVTLRFTLAYRETRRELALPEEEPPEFKYVMRRPKPVPRFIHHQVYADEFRMEYFDGNGWNTIPGLKAAGILSREQEPDGGERVLSFQCPLELTPCTINGEERYWLRLRLLRAENSGWLPCIYHAPEIAGLRFSCGYETPVQPERILCAATSATEPESSRELCGSALRLGVPLFRPIRGAHEELYLGFDRKPGTPFRLYLELEERQAASCSFSYSRMDGAFLPAEVQDRTDGLSHSGAISLPVLNHFGAAELFGKKLWWLRIEDTEDNWAGGKGLPVLRGIHLNSVAADCVEEWGGEMVPAGSKFHFREGSSPAEVRSITATYGGSPPESPRQAAVRATSELRRQGRAVTLGDLEQLLRGAYSDIDKVRCVPDWTRKTVYAAVLMRDFWNHSAAFERRCEGLEQLAAEQSGLSCLGLRCEIRQPAFLLTRASAWLRMSAGETLAELEREAITALERFLHPVTGGFDGRGWPIGTLPTQGQLRTCLRLAVPDLTVEELLLSRYSSEDGTEQSLDLFRGNPFALAVSGPHGIHLLDSVSQR